MQTKESKISKDIKPQPLNKWTHEKRINNNGEMLFGQPVRDQILNSCRALINGYNLKPRLTIVSAYGFDNASEVYINNKIKTCEEVGIDVDVVKIKFDHGSRDIFLNQLFHVINILNVDPMVDGYFVQMPLPFDIKLKEFANMIDPSKDVDGFTATNLGKSFNNDTNLISCTPQGIIDLLKYYNVNLSGLDVVVVNRSNIVGIPLIPLLLKEDSTVTVCHSKTKSLKNKTQGADVVITAVGIPNFMDETWFKDGATIIDVSMNRDDDGSLCGDVKKSAYTKCNLKITPVPKGVGVITTANVIKNVIMACINRKAVK